MSAISAEEFTFQVTSTTVTLFAKPAFKIRVLIGIQSCQLNPHVCFLDTAASLDIFSKSFLQNRSATKIRYQLVPKLCIASKNLIRDDFLFLTWWQLTRQSCSRYDCESRCRQYLGYTYIKLVYPQNISWRRKSCTVTLRTGTHSHEAVFRKVNNIFCTSNYPNCLFLTWGHCMEYEEGNLSTLHQNPNKRGHAQFKTVLSWASIPHPTVSSPSCSAWNNKAIKRWQVLNEIFISSLGATMQILSIEMNVAYAVTRPPITINLPHEQASTLK